MNKSKICICILALFLSFFSLKSFAWDNSIELGYGFSHDPNHTKYNNYGVMLSGDLYPLWRNSWSFWSINGALGQWHTTSPVNKNLTTGSLGLGLRLYPLDLGDYPSYLLATVAPAILSNRKFGLNTQASNLTIQTDLGLGVEFDCIDLNLRLVHFSNAGLGKPNEGFNILYMLSLGYLF